MILNNVENNQIFKDDNYTTAYADGIILEFRDDSTVRLIFYQEDVVGKQHDSSKLDETKKVKNLLFEIRMPEKAFAKLADNGSWITMTEALRKLSPKNVKDDPHLISSREKFKQTILSRFIDCNYPDEKLDNEIGDYFRDILDRTMKRHELEKKNE